MSLIDRAALREAVQHVKFPKQYSLDERAPAHENFLLGAQAIHPAYVALIDAAPATEPVPPQPWDNPVAVTGGVMLGELPAAEPVPLTLDAAWAEAEEALPEGWWVHALYAWSFDDMAYRAEAASPGRQQDMSHSASTRRHGTRTWVSGPSAIAYGATPAEALRNLAAALARPEPSVQEDRPVRDPESPAP